MQKLRKLTLSELVSNEGAINQILSANNLNELRGGDGYMELELELELDKKGDKKKPKPPVVITSPPPGTIGGGVGVRF